MSLKDPKEIFKIFHSHYDKLNSANDSLSPEKQKAMASELCDVYNYLSEVTNEKNQINYFYRLSAHDAKVKKQLELERDQLDKTISFVESSYDKVDNYLKTIQLAGYAAFFALWGITKEFLSTSESNIVLLLMISSASMFMLWELIKSMMLALAIRHYSSLAMLPLEKFISSSLRTKNRSLLILRISKYRIFPWFLCTTTAVSSLCILIFKLLNNILI